MLLVGDKIKQVKEIKGFNFVGREFSVDAVEGNSISFSSSFGRGVMTLTEFEEYFEKIIEPNREPSWSEWELYERFLEYRVKGDLVEVRSIYGGGSVFCKPCEEDKFDLQKGLEICELKFMAKKEKQSVERHQRQLEEIMRQLSKY